MLVALALVAACLAGTAGYQRFADGTHLVVLNGNEVSGSMRVGVPASTGIPMWTEGGPSVDLQSVADDHSPNVTVRYSLIRRGPRDDGIGFVYGPSVAWHPIAISGARVSQPARKLVETTCSTGSSTVVSACAPAALRDADPGSTSLVVTVVATAPGPWYVTNFRVNYSSWRRNRTAQSSFVMRGVATEPSG